MKTFPGMSHKLQASQLYEDANSALQFIKLT